MLKIISSKNTEIFLFLNPNNRSRVLFGYDDSYCSFPERNPTYQDPEFHYYPHPGWIYYDQFFLPLSPSTCYQNLPHWTSSTMVQESFFHIRKSTISLIGLSLIVESEVCLCRLICLPFFRSEFSDFRRSCFSSKYFTILNYFWRIRFLTVKP